MLNIRSEIWRRFLKPKLRSATLREKCPYLELFWSVFSRIRENTDQNNSEHGLRNAWSTKLFVELTGYIEKSLDVIALYKRLFFSFKNLTIIAYWTDFRQHNLSFNLFSNFYFFYLACLFLLNTYLENQILSH